MAWRKTAWVIAVCLALVMAFVAYGFLSQRPSSGCPAIFADVSFPSYSGFVTVTHPNPSYGGLEFVLKPDAEGRITVNYKSSDNNLTSDPLRSELFSMTIASWKVESNGTLVGTTGLNVSLISASNPDAHLVIANYSVKAGPQEGLFALGFPSTCIGTVVQVGTQPYFGPLPWQNSTIA